MILACCDEWRVESRVQRETSISSASLGVGFVYLSTALRRVSRVLWGCIAFAIVGVSLLMTIAQAVFWAWFQVRSWAGDESGGLLVSFRSEVKSRFLRVWWVSRFHFGQSLLFFRRGIVPVVG